MTRGGSQKNDKRQPKDASKQALIDFTFDRWIAFSSVSVLFCCPPRSCFRCTATLHAPLAFATKRLNVSLCVLSNILQQKESLYIRGQIKSPESKKNNKGESRRFARLPPPPQYLYTHQERPLPCSPLIGSKKKTPFLKIVTSMNPMARTAGTTDTASCPALPIRRVNRYKSKTSYASPPILTSI